jgi:hypothetical protein
MKKYSILIIFSILFISVSAQKKEKLVIPPVVMESVKAIYPQLMSNPNAVKWEKEGLNFKASLTQSEYPGLSVLDSTGRVLRMEQKTTEKSLSAKAMNYLSKEYPGMSVEEVWMVTDEKSVVTYKTRIVIRHDFVFDTNGDVVKPKTTK